MNEKLKKISKKLEPLVKNSNNATEIYEKLSDIANEQKEYFETLGPKNFLKIVVYIYSLKKTNSFSLGDKILENLQFAQLLYTENEPHFETCPECEGNGEQRCGVCDDGITECDECQGDGDFDCSRCDGSGEVHGDDGPEECDDCGGTGRDECGQCGGDGNVTCNECDGSGHQSCDECRGQGEVQEKGYVNTEFYFIATWDPYIKNRCELEEKTLNQVFGKEFLEENENKIILNIELTPTKVNVDPYEFYCINYTDDPNLMFIYRMLIKENNPIDISYLYQ